MREFYITEWFRNKGGAPSPWWSMALQAGLRPFLTGFLHHLSHPMKWMLASTFYGSKWTKVIEMWYNKACLWTQTICLWSPPFGIHLEISERKALLTEFFGSFWDTIRSWGCLTSSMKLIHWWIHSTMTIKMWVIVGQSRDRKETFEGYIWDYTPPFSLLTDCLRVSALSATHSCCHDGLIWLRPKK